MNEPNFQCTKVCEQIRLTFLPTWGNPEIFRIEKCGFDINGFYKKTNGAGGYDQGDLAINEIKELTIKDWNLMNAKFSKLKSNRLSNEQNGGLDGSIWLIERIVKEKYEYIERWTLERKDIDQELFEYCKEFQNITRSR